MAELPAQPSLRRMRRFAVRPDRELGQNFLIDSNILGVIARAASLGPADVVLEIGGGVGVLTEYLAERAHHVHVVEVDERLHAALKDATDPHANVSVHWGDAMRIDLTCLDPEPTKVIANLPYGIAAGALLRTIEQLERLGTWVAMMQREVGERLAAAPGSPAYGAPSAIAQLECEVEVLRAIPRTVFRPVPNVDSVLVRLCRRAGPGPAASPATASAADSAAGAADSAADSAAADSAAADSAADSAAEPAAEPAASSAAVRALIAGSFAHRRKTLAGSLSLSGGAGGRGRADVRQALQQLGHPADVRAERLSAEDFRALARMLGL